MGSGGLVRDTLQHPSQHSTFPSGFLIRGLFPWINKEMLHNLASGCYADETVVSIGGGKARQLVGRVGGCGVGVVQSLGVLRRCLG